MKVRRERRLLARVLVCLPAALAACAVGNRPTTLAGQLAAAATAVREGRIEDAAAQIEDARRRFPGSVEAARWSARLADLLWQDERAIAEQTAAVRLARRSGEKRLLAAMQGHLGDLLFQAGRWGESVVPLTAGALGRQRVRRLAYAAVAATLPFVRRFSGPILTEQPWRPGAPPEFVCGTRALLRPFAIDTGTSLTTVAASFAEELDVRGRRPAGDAFDGTGRRLPIEVGMLSRFGIGGVDIGDIPVLVVSDRALRLRDFHGGPEREPRGVLGLDLLAACRLTIDPERGSVVLELPQGLPGSSSVQCVRADGRCLVPVVVEGVRLWFVFDTGASHSSLTELGLRSIQGGGRRAVPTFRRVRTVGGATVAVREVRNLVVRCSGARFVQVTLPVIDRGQSGTFPVHGVIGVDLLGRCRVTFDRGRVRLAALQ